VFNLINQGASPIFQAQIGLPRLSAWWRSARSVQFSLEVQLKATSANHTPDARGRYPFSLTLDHHNKLRDVGAAAQQILVVLFLPEDQARWIDHTLGGLISRRCAFWVSLSNAPVSVNQTSQTVYIPEVNLFSIEGLRSVMARCSRGDRIDYEL